MGYCKYCMDFEEGTGENSTVIGGCVAMEDMLIHVQMSIDGGDEHLMEEEYQVTHGADIGLYAYEDGRDASLSIGLLLNEIAGSGKIISGSQEIRIRYCPFCGRDLSKPPRR